MRLSTSASVALIALVAIWALGAGLSMLGIWLDAPYAHRLWSRYPLVGVWAIILLASAALGWPIARRVGVVGASVVAVALAVSWWSWSEQSPREWFREHQGSYEEAVQIPMTTDAYYGQELPSELSLLTVDGRMSEQCLGRCQASADRIMVRFFPMWEGTPDDAGGFLYSPEVSPSGADMYGMPCEAPVDLGAGWWMCGMADES